MKVVTRINITDPVLLRRIGLARDRIGYLTATATAYRLLEQALDKMEIPLDGMQVDASAARDTDRADVAHDVPGAGSTGSNPATQAPAA